MTRDRHAPRQLPLDLAHGPAHSRDDLVVTPSNERAVALIEAWPGWRSPVTVLAGPAGSGKTHLAAIWAEATGAAVAPASAIDPAFLALTETRPLLIEDADRPGLDEKGLFHLINAVRGADSHLLLTARRFPLGWGVELPDLRSRLQAAATVEIDEPDDMLLAGVLVKLFADRQVSVEPHVVQFITRRIERSLSAVQRVVEELDRAALERKTRITRPLAAEVVARFETGQH